jgi:hypothetical protein
MPNPGKMGPAPTRVATATQARLADRQLTAAQQQQAAAKQTVEMTPAQREWLAQAYRNMGNVTQGFGAAVGNAAGNIMSAVATKALGTPEDPTAKYDRANAQLARQAAARQQKDAQKQYQIANKDARVEGDKDAIAAAGAKYEQNMAQQQAASGGGASYLNSQAVEDPTQNYQYHWNRSDAARRYGENTQSAAELNLQHANEMEGRAEDNTQNNAELNTANAEWSAASQGQGATNTDDYSDIIDPNLITHISGANIGESKPPGDQPPAPPPPVQRTAGDLITDIKRLNGGQTTDWYNRLDEAAFEKQTGMSKAAARELINKDQQQSGKSVAERNDQYQNGVGVRYPSTTAPTGLHVPGDP